jgi:hypothetical protein
MDAMEKNEKNIIALAEIHPSSPVVQHTTDLQYQLSHVNSNQVGNIVIIFKKKINISMYRFLVFS